jgi:multidrug efflux pump
MGQLSSVDAFRNITIKSETTGARLKLSDIARVESGLQSYAFGIREKGYLPRQPLSSFRLAQMR